METVLVTGAGGLVGSEAAKALMKCPEKKVFAAFHNPSVPDGLQIDLESTDVEKLGIEFDCIVHCAARIPNHLYSDEQVSCINRRIDDNVIHYCMSHKCRLIYLSFVAYGSCNRELLGKQTNYDISTKYIGEKRNSERKIEEGCDSYCILKVPSPYGAGQKNKTVLKTWIEAASRGEDICYFGKGQRTQNFVDARDVARAILKAVKSQENGIFNIASESSISMINLANLVSEIGRSEFSVVSNVRASGSADMQEDVRINVSIERAENVLGWKPQIKLEDGIRDWMRWIKRNGMYKEEGNAG